MNWFNKNRFFMKTVVPFFSQTSFSIIHNYAEDIVENSRGQLGTTIAKRKLSFFFLS